MGVIVFEYENDFNRIPFERNACCMEVHLSCRHKQHVICYHVYVHAVSKTKVFFWASTVGSLHSSMTSSRLFLRLLNASSVGTVNRRPYGLKAMTGSMHFFGADTIGTAPNVSMTSSRFEFFSQ